MALGGSLVGLPNVGESIMFNGLSSGNAASANFHFCTIEPDVGVVALPDPRIELFAELAHSTNTVRRRLARSREKAV